MKLDRNKIFSFALAAVFALALAGCGGGGTAEETMMMQCPEGKVGTYPDCTDPPPPADEAAATAAATAAGAAQTAFDGIPEGDAGDANRALAMAANQEAQDAAAAARTAADADDELEARIQQRIAENARDDVVKYAAAAAKDISDAAETARIAAITKSAETKADAIGVEAAQTTDAGLGGTATTATGNVEGAYNIEIERDRDATTVTVTVEGATDADDEDFVQAMDFGDGRFMQTRTHDADADDNVVTEVVMVRTDIEAPEAVEFAKFESDIAGTTPQALDVRVDGETATTANPNDALNIDADNFAMMKASAFTAPAGTTGTTVLTFQHEVEDDAGTADVDESRDAAEIMGTFNGAMGTYKCNAASANCSVTVDGKGVVSAVSTDNDWIFIPAEGATSDQPDYDYLHYGFWLQRTADKDGVVTYNEVETFAGSSVAVSGSVASVTGSASYEGGAVGVYVHRTFANNGTSNATSGHFSADASLTATFGQVEENGVGTIAPNQLNRLTGTIDNFTLNRSGGGTDDGSAWSVEFSGAINTGAGTAASAADSDTPFSATFHGPTGDTNTDKPHSVVGEFNASFTNGTVAGAFGARKTD